MTAHKPAKPSPTKAVVSKPDLGSPTNVWDVIRHAIDMIGYAIESTPRTRRLNAIILRLCLILALGVVLAALIVLRFWV